MSFDEIRLPEDIEQGAQGGPEFFTQVSRLANGSEKRNAVWSQSKPSWDVGYGIQSLSDLRTVLTFFYARRGRLRGFRFKDYSDYTVSLQTLGTGTGALTTFQAFKRYTDDGGTTFDRTLTKLVTGSVTVLLNGVPTALFSVNYNTGVITMNSAPANGVAITYRCEFDVPVRFDTDKLDVNLKHFDAGSVPSIPIIGIGL